MALCRIKTVEKMRGHAPGEFGKLLGLDRIPEVRCLSKKIEELSADDTAEKWITKKANILEEIEQYKSELSTVKAKIKITPKHITWDKLEEQDKFFHLLPGQKRLMDNVKMISYRAETAMANILKTPRVDMPAARRLLQDLYVTEADILPKPKEKLLIVRVHKASRPAANLALDQLFKELNSAKICYPGTDMRMNYVLARSDPG
ncbi:MAG: putative transposase [Desulfotignum sp.]